MNITVTKTSHNAPPAKNLSQYFIRGVVKKRVFKSEADILKHYNKECNYSDIVRASSDVRYTLEPIHVTINLNGKIIKETIPAFFVYDGLSIGLLQTLASRQSRLSGAVHDWLYYSGRYDRETCDAVMRAVQLYRGNNVFTTGIYHIGVRLLGKGSYEQYREVK